MKKNGIKNSCEFAIISGLYVALTWLFAPISFGPIQFRISEVLVLMIVLNRKYIIPIVLGCLIANTTSPIGIYDVIFGTCATLLAGLCMMKFKNVWICAMFPVIFNGIIIPVELGIVYDMFDPVSFWFNVLTVSLGELIVIFGIGIPIIYLLKKNKKIMELICEG